jgi:hypothetical protein
MDVHRVLNERLNTLDRLILRLEEQTRIAVD